MTLQQAIDEYVMQRSILNPHTNRRIYVGPFKQTDQYRNMTERMMQQDTGEKSQQDYLVKGWRRNEFWSKAEFDQWVEEHIPYVEYAQAKKNILEHGQTAIARVRDDTEFLRIDLEPVPGRWWRFKTQAVLDEWKRINFRFHISLTRKEHSDEDPEVFRRIKRRWDGREVTIRIKSVESSGNLILDPEDGIGADPYVQKLYNSGTFWRKAKKGYGPHISM